jgi:hypothetical protein
VILCSSSHAFLISVIVCVTVLVLDKISILPNPRAISSSVCCRQSIYVFKVRVTVGTVMQIDSS